jgi:hypothetical protein
MIEGPGEREVLVALASARLIAATTCPYLASALFAMTPVVQPNRGTFSIDRWWRVYVDPVAIEAWSIEEVAAVLLHEVAHVLRDHHGRAGRKIIGPHTALLWNLAADAEINDDLVGIGLALPDPVLPGSVGLPDGLFAEDYYDRWPVDHTRSLDCGSGAHDQARGR